MRTVKPSKENIFAVFITVLCLCEMFVCAIGVMAQEEGKKPHEPDLTRSESALLKKARQVAEDDLEKARKLLKKSIDSKSSAALPFALGVYHRRGENRPEAAEAFRDALDRKNDFHRARMNLVRLLFEMEKYDHAVGQLQTLLNSSYGEKRKLWKLTGYAYLMSEDYVAAEQAYRNATVRGGMKRDVGLGLARALMNQNRLEAAGGVARGLLADHPASADLWMLLANVDLSKGRDREALGKLETMRRLGLADSSALLTLGDLLLNQDCPVEALRTYQEAAQIEDVSVSRLIRAARGLIGKGYTEQGRQLVSLLKKRGNIPEDQSEEFRLLQAHLAEADGELDSALASYEKVLEANPLHARALLRAGNLLRRKGRLEEALIRLERAARTDKSVRPRALVRQAQIAVEREEYKEATKLLRKSLQIRDREYVREYLESIQRMVEKTR